MDQDVIPLHKSSSLKKFVKNRIKSKLNLSNYKQKDINNSTFNNRQDEKDISLSLQKSIDPNEHCWNLVHNANVDIFEIGEQKNLDDIKSQSTKKKEKPKYIPETPLPKKKLFSNIVGTNFIIKNKYNSIIGKSHRKDRKDRKDNKTSIDKDHQIDYEMIK